MRCQQVKELTEAAARGATGPLTSAIVDLSKRLGITEDATKTPLRIVGEQDVPLERLSETLNRVANDYKRLQGQAAALNPDNPTARILVTQAKAAIDVGQLGSLHESVLSVRLRARSANTGASSRLNYRLLGTHSKSRI